MVLRVTGAPSRRYFSDRIWRIVMRGFSDAYGSWNTICMSRRALRRASLPSPVTLTPSSVTWPAVGSTSRRIAPAVHVEGDPVDGLDLADRALEEHAGADGEVLDQVPHLEHGLAVRLRGPGAALFSRLRHDHASLSARGLRATERRSCACRFTPQAASGCRVTPQAPSACLFTPQAPFTGQPSPRKPSPPGRCARTPRGGPCRPPTPAAGSRAGTPRSRTRSAG